MEADLSPAGPPSGQAPFETHVELLRLFISNREKIVESIEAVLNAQRKPVRYRSLLSGDFERCFSVCSASASQTHLRSLLEETHRAAGFKARQVQHLYNDLIDPTEMMLRALHCWQQTRWPGRSDRLHYAHTLFNLYALRWLQFLSLRVFDSDASSAAGRLAEMQGVLDELWRSSPANQPVFLRDARWLIPLALSLITDELAPYFEVARQITDTLSEADVLEIQRAYVRMLGGHLTSQIRYYCTRDRLSIGDPSVVLRTRASNALDLALLVQGLVPLLKAYDRALRTGDERMRLEMAGAIFQGISPDPELFLIQPGILSAYTMIEHVFIATDPDGHVVYSPAGRRHVRILEEYGALMDRLIQPLREDFPRFKPRDGGCSPYGVLFGLPSNLIEHMALKALERDAETRFSLEDVFQDDVFRDDVSGDATAAARLAWVNGWRKLPHVGREVQRLFDYPQQFADDIYNRIGQELSRHDTPNPGCLHIEGGDTIPEVPAHYFFSSDKQIITEGRAETHNPAQLLASRQEGHFLVSYETSGGWIALKKDLLTEILGAGHDARIVGLPPDAAQVLQLMCTGLVKAETVSEQAERA